MAFAHVDRVSGAEWESLGLDGVIVNVLARSETFLYAGAKDGIYRKDLDSEGEWIRLGLEGENAAGLFIDPTAPDTLFAGIGLGPETQGSPFPDVVTLYKSIDGGSTWAPSDNGIHGFSVHTLAGPHDDARVLYAGGVIHVSRSVDGGGSWTQLPYAEFPVGYSAAAFALAPSNPQVLYVGGGTPILRAFLKKSTNGGESWVPSAYPFGPGSIFTIAVDAKDAEIVYAHQGIGVWKSVDGGDRFERVSPGFFVDTLIADPAVSGRIYTGGSVQVDSAFHSVVFESHDGGANWTDLEGPGGFTSVKTILLDRSNDSEILYVGTYGTGVFRFDLLDRLASAKSSSWFNYP